MASRTDTPPAVDPLGAPTGGFRITHERGPMTRQVRAAVLAEGGEAAWRELLATVSEPCRARFSGTIGAFEWVESELALELHRAWITRIGQETMAQRGQDAARQILDGPQQWLVRMATPAFLVSALPKLFDFYYRGGELRVLTQEPGFARLALRGEGYFPAWYAEALPAWAVEALRLAGAEALQVQHRPPHEGGSEPHLYELRWRAK